MARKKPPLSLRRPADVIDPLQAERFVRGLAVDAAPTTQALDVVTSGRPGAQTSDVTTQVSPTRSKSLVYRKRTDDHRRRMTIYLPEDLARRLRLYASDRDQDYSVVLAEALGVLLDREGR